MCPKLSPWNSYRLYIRVAAPYACKPTSTTHLLPCRPVRTRRIGHRSTAVSRTVKSTRQNRTRVSRRPHHNCSRACTSQSIHHGFSSHVHRACRLGRRNMNLGRANAERCRMCAPSGKPAGCDSLITKPPIYCKLIVLDSGSSFTARVLSHCCVGVLVVLVSFWCDLVRR